MAKTTATKAAEWQKSPADGETLDVGPEESPYTSPICKIYFKNQQPFTIPRDLIRASVELDKICGSSNSSIHIKNVPDEAGHVLVHYLYTGTWQTLSKRHSLQDSKASTHLETSVYVYAAARAYALPGLAELAKENISKSANRLLALDVIVLAAAACEVLPDTDLWFLAFIKMRIEHLFEDLASLNQSVFLGCFHVNTSYSKILTKSLVRICCDNSISLKSVGSRVPSSPEPSTTTEIYATPSTDSPQTIHDSEPEPEAWAEFVPEPSPEPAEIEAEPSAEVAAEPQLDSWADSIPEPNPEPELAAETEEFAYARPKKGKKDKKKGKKEKKGETQEDVCF
ncbi:hypothetical protein LZ30DRAFT_787691 [Colletotrichum cereale]|nr:hypothetical protein LZ30DRAFT_787691 [Colletotrichum cereale]